MLEGAFMFEESLVESRVVHVLAIISQAGTIENLQVISGRAMAAE
jgi:hypothetical protein